MPILIPPRTFVRKRRHRAAPASPVAALMLVSATCEEGSWVRLGFDRAIDIAGLVGSQITVDDGSSTAMRYDATGTATLISPTVVQIELVSLGEWTEPGLTLNATAGTGIVAVDDGGEWAGVVALPLPFP